MIIIKWFKNKLFEIEMKHALYSTVEEFVKEQEDIIKLVKNLYVVLKDVPVDELQKEFIHALAKVVHETNEKDKAEQES